MISSDAQKGIQKAVGIVIAWSLLAILPCPLLQARVGEHTKEGQEGDAEKLKDVSDDEIMMQNLAEKLRDHGHSSATETLMDSGSIGGIIGPTLRHNGKRYAKS